MVADFLQIPLKTKFDRIHQETDQVKEEILDFQQIFKQLIG